MNTIKFVIIYLPLLDGRGHTTLKSAAAQIGISTRWFSELLKEKCNFKYKDYIILVDTHVNKCVKGFAIKKYKKKVKLNKA